MRIAVVGLGKMGRALVRRLLSQGYEVLVWNRTAAIAKELASEGALELGELREAWQGADAVCTFLADDLAVRTVLLGTSGLLAGASSDALLVEMSTISPAASHSVAEESSRRGVSYLRCPVSGNPDVLMAGRLTLIASGPLKTYERAHQLLADIGPVIFYVGPGDEARTMKLAVNAMLAATAEALAESVVLCEATGIARGVALEVIARSAVGSPFVGYKRDALLEHRYEATFTTAMLSKDLELVLATARSKGLQLPLADLVAGLAQETCAEGLGTHDFMSLLLHLQVLAGRPTDIAIGESPHR